jgi:hypothetical protein
MRSNSALLTDASCSPLRAHRGAAKRGRYTALRWIGIDPKPPYD